MQEHYRILSTRLLPQQLIDRAAIAGISLDCIPFISTIPVSSEALITELRSLALQEQHVLFTSAKAVAAVADHLREIPSRWSIYCISGATLKEVHERFPGIAIAGTADDAAALAAVIKEHSNLQSVAFFCGDISMRTLEQALERDISVNRIVVYTTMLTPVRVMEDYAAILFFSPSAVESYLSLNSIHPETVVFTIGKTTAASLQDFPNKIIACTTPDAGSMMQQVIDYFLPVKAGASPTL